MTKVYIKRFISIFAVIVVVCILFYLYLPPKWGPITYMNKEMGLDKVDVVCIGSSHVFNGIVPHDIYEDIDVIAYDVAVGGQSPWNSYYYIKAVYKYQHPSIIILDMYIFGRADGDTIDYKHTVENLLTYPSSLDKVKAVWASGIENKLDMLLMFPFTHDEYSSVTDLTCDKVGGTVWTLGYSYVREAYSGEGLNIVDVSDVDKVEKIDPKCEQYLTKSIEFCQEHGINLILVNTPWPRIDDETQAKYNYISYLADRYDVPFLDGCKMSDKVGIDYYMDSYDGSHLNYDGAKKWTRYISDYIANNYDFSDIRVHGQYSYIYKQRIAEFEAMLSDERENL